MVHYLFTSNSMMKKETNQGKTTKDKVLKRVTPQEEPQAGTAGRIPGEDNVIMGDDSSMQLIAP